MKLRWCCVGGALYGAALLGAHLLAPEPDPSAINAPSQGSHFLEQHRRAERLDGEWASMYRRQHARQSTIEEVLAGRLSVAQAVERFEALNRLPPDCRTALRCAYPGASDTECARHQVYRRLQEALVERPDQADAIRRYLQTQDIKVVKSAGSDDAARSPTPPGG